LNYTVKKKISQEGQGCEILAVAAVKEQAPDWRLVLLLFSVNLVYK
jgi:hypothetical protein